MLSSLKIVRQVSAAAAGFMALTGFVATGPAQAGGIVAPPPPAAVKPAAEDPEVKMGREAHEDLLKSGIKIIRDPKVVERVETIGKKIAAVTNQTPIEATYGSSKLVPYEYRFFVVDDKDVNAFSLPGGYIYINKGLLNYVQSDDELAGVLGHEIIHAAHHHVAKLQKEQTRLNGQMLWGLFAAFLARVPSEDVYNLMTGLQLLAVQKVNGHGQNAERDADRAGIIVARKAGYNPVGALTFMERLARDEKARREVELGIFRTHPPSRERADAMIAQITGMGLPINRREVTNAIKAEVRQAAAGNGAAPAGAADVVLGGRVLFRAASPERAERAAQVINRLLDQDLQIYDIKQNGAAVVARGQTILRVEPDDAALAEPAGSAEAVAEQAFKVLRTALYKQFLDGAY
jgi:hypothetical protein